MAVRGAVVGGAAALWEPERTWDLVAEPVAMAGSVLVAAGAERVAMLTRVRAGGAAWAVVGGALATRAAMVLAVRGEEVGSD